MKAFTVWVKKSDVTLYIGGNPDKGESPMITATLEKPQIVFDPDKKTITILETK